MARTTIDLSRLPPPDAVQVLDHAAIWAEVKAQIIAAYPAAAPALELNSELIVKAGQAFAYRLMLKANEENASVRAVMPALATGADLDQLGVIVGIQRLVIDEGDPDQNIAPTYEDDDAFRRRFLLAPDGYSVAGPAGAYEFLALSADGEVKDASAVSPATCEVTVNVLSRLGDGTASAELLATVQAALSDQTVRPLCDLVTVQSASITTYAIEAVIWTGEGPDTAVVMAAAQARAAAFAAETHALNRDVNLSAVYHALTASGVVRVDLVSPAANIVCGEGEAAFCTGVTLSFGGVDE
jgi:phage-related baseplate assembly protein